MDFFKFLRQEHSKTGYYAVLATVAAGVFNGLLAGLVIITAQHIQPGEKNFKYLLLFAAALGLYWYAKRYSLSRNTELVEMALARIRHRVTNAIRKSDLEKFEQVGAARITNVISTDAVTLSQYTPFLINAASALVMIVVAFFFVWFMSKLALVLTMVVLIISLIYYFVLHRELKVRIEQTSAKQTEYFEGLGALLGGFKELRINQAKNEDFFQNRLCVLSEEMRDLKFSTGRDFNKLYLFAQCFAFILLGTILFIIPTISPDQTSVIPQVVAIILFVLGPIGEVVGCAPLLAQCNNAVRNIQQLEDDLRQPADPKFPVRAEKESAGFENIELRGITYTYQHPSGEQGFTLGPVDFSITRGETVFLVGGNGSGKSTLLKLFLNLYQPAGGELHWNGTRVSNVNAERYRDLFSIVLSDYHLFDRLYGLEVVDVSRTEQLLDRMHLSGVTQIVDGRITNTKLSGGQRKRLALVVSLLEDKPVYVFDEWAADQDPEFRRHFYEVILPEMKRRGTTVLAATHDDRYFAHADRIVKMDLGNFVQP